MRLLQVVLAWFGAALFGSVVLFSACARPGSPSGGPRDLIPPMIASTWPDTFEIIEATRDPVKITFSERISERPTEGSLESAVLVSPVTGEHRVKTTRSGLEIEVIGGFQPGLVYRVRVLPIIKDLFNNPLEGPFELVFSTGPVEYETNVFAGIVKDRITGEVIERVRVEARKQGVEDPPVYMATTDSVGIFALRYLPSGSYDISIYEDINRNTEVDYAELQGDTVGSFGSQPPLADTVIFREVVLLRPDTIPPRLIGVEALDSILIGLSFAAFLDTEGSLGPFHVEITSEEGPGPEIDRLIWPRQLDSLRAVADSVAAEERRVAIFDSLGVVADSLAQVLSAMEAAGDTLGTDTLRPFLELIQTRIAPPEPSEEPAPEAAAEPPPILPKQEFYVLLAESLASGRLYDVIVSGVANINGTGGGGGEASFSWERPDPDPAEVPDTAGVVPDTAGVPPDTSGVPPDTGRVAPPDTSGVLPDTGPANPAEAQRPALPWWLRRRGQ